MKTYRKYLPKERYALDYIYKKLTGTDIKKHHTAIDDCINTYKCFKLMCDKKYEFDNVNIYNKDDYFTNLLNISDKCRFCHKCVKNSIHYKYINKKNLFTENNKIYKIINHILLSENDILCKSCLSNIEIITTDKKNMMINIYKMIKSYKMKEFFDIIK